MIKWRNDDLKEAIESCLEGREPYLIVCDSMHDLCEGKILEWLAKFSKWLELFNDTVKIGQEETDEDFKIFLYLVKK